MTTLLGYASYEPLWRMRPGRPDDEMDDICRGRFNEGEEMGGTDPSAESEQALAKISFAASVLKWAAPCNWNCLS
jgi:hypothetical protein